MLKIKDLEVFYGRHKALDNVNLEIDAQKTFGLIGLNGAGKTTLIKTILGLRQANKGSINFFDKEKNELSENQIKKKIAYLPERFEPPLFLKGMEFIKFSASLYKQKLSEEDIIALTKSFDLDPDVLKRSANTYSKGMRQKLGLIATIMTGCEFLILDEPMSGLDPKARVCVKDNIVSLQKEGRTIFLSSHILSDMNEICDNVAILHHKKIKFYGSPKELMGKYNMQSLERAFLETIKDEKDAA